MRVWLFVISKSPSDLAKERYYRFMTLSFSHPCHLMRRNHRLLVDFFTNNHWHEALMFSFCQLEKSDEIFLRYSWCDMSRRLYVVTSMKSHVTTHLKITHNAKRTTQLKLISTVNNHWWPLPNAPPDMTKNNHYLDANSQWVCPVMFASSFRWFLFDSILVFPLAT